MNLLVTFAQASGKHMILPTIQLLRMALITRLLLLLFLLTRLMLIMTALMSLKAGTGTATRAMKTASS